jgi:hypothetical protein
MRQAETQYPQTPPFFQGQRAKSGDGGPYASNCPTGSRRFDFHLFNTSSNIACPKTDTPININFGSDEKLLDKYQEFDLYKKSGKLYK